jgi:hypothetical protein
MVNEVYNCKMNISFVEKKEKLKIHLAILLIFKCKTKVVILISDKLLKNRLKRIVLPK